ncbi:hypothetical protein ACQ4PT_030715 [Festuca glaucescens]
MEFQFRAGGEPSRPPPPSTDSTATPADSQSAATHVRDSHGDHSMGYHGENAGPVLPPPASDPDELWRQAAKARIREWILREEAELEALEAQVRRELMEERTPLLRSGLGRSAGSGAALGSAPTPAPSGTQTRIELEALSKANASVTLPVKRKNTDVALASSASISTSTNKKELRCTLCDIPATSEKALQDHLKGKAHMKKAAKLAPWHEDDDEILHTFVAASGLHVNYAKSAAAPIRCSPVPVEAISLAFACPLMQFPCFYISLPLSLGRLHKRDLQYVLDKLAGKLALWKAKFLSKEGRITYIQAIMAAFAIYHLLALDLELWFLQAVDKLRRGFLWAGSHEALGGQCRVAWHLAMQVHSKENVLAVLPDKKKDPNIVTVTSKTQKPDLICKLPSKENVPKDAFILSATESDKKQNLNLSCTLCGIPLTSEKAMEDHLKGKSHRKKATALVREATEHVQEEKEEKCSFTPTKKTMMTKDGMIHDVMQIDEKEEEASFTPTKKTMMTKDGTIHDVMQMNGYVFCEVCNVRTADIVTMMCHLQGIKHISKARQEARKPPAETVTIATSVANGDPQMVAMRINGVPHNVRRVGGSLLCELCDVKVPEALQGVMQSHLSGKIHTKKLKAMAAAVDKGAVGKAEVITRDVALATNFHITETPGQEEMMDDGADSIGGSELW